MRDTCFLLGAGASVEAGLPAMARLRSDFLTAYEEQVLSGCLHEFIESWCEHQHIAYTDGFNQHDAKVCTFTRAVLLPCRPAGAV